MEYTVFLNRIKKDMIQGPYAFVGEEIYLADNTIDALKNKYIIESFEAMNFKFIDASKSNVNEILESCYQLPFMSEKRLTVVKDISDNQIKELGTKIEELISIGSSSIVIFLFCPKDIKKTTNFYKILSKADSIVHFDSVTEAQLKNWVQRKISQNKIEIDDDAFEMFLLHINYTKDNDNSSLYFVDGELNKLSSIGKKNISIGDIEEITSKSPSSNIFKLTDAISMRDEKKSLMQLNKLFETNEDPVKIAYMIARHIMNMSKIYQTLNLSEYEAIKRVGISQFEYRKIRANINNYKIEELKNGLELIKQADIILKSKKNDSKTLLESTLIGFFRFKNIYEV